jgi:hypothetical protein
MNEVLPGCFNVYDLIGLIILAVQVLDGIYTLRFVIGNPRTDRAHVLAAWDVINKEAEKLLKGSA